MINHLKTCAVMAILIALIAAIFIYPAVGQIICMIVMGIVVLGFFAFFYTCIYKTFKHGPVKYREETDNISDCW